MALLIFLVVIYLYFSLKLSPVPAFSFFCSFFFVMGPPTSALIPLTTRGQHNNASSPQEPCPLSVGRCWGTVLRTKHVITEHLNSSGKVSQQTQIHDTGNSQHPCGRLQGKASSAGSLAIRSSTCGWSAAALMDAVIFSLQNTCQAFDSDGFISS